jgi:hypothetical protein
LLYSSKANPKLHSRGHNQPCPICKIHLDGQKLSFQCPEVKTNVDIAGRYSDIFTDKIDSKLAKTLVNIMNRVLFFM